MENKLAVLLEVLLADRPLSDEMMELVFNRSQKHN